MREQVRIAAAISQALKGSSAEEGRKSADAFTKALEDSGEAAKKSATISKASFVEISKNILQTVVPINKVKNSLTGFSSSFTYAGAAAAGFADGVIDSFRFISAAFRSGAELISSIASGFFRVSKAIFSIPFKVLDGLISMSNKLSVILEDIARATEDVRKQFGDLASGPGKAVNEIAKNMSGTFGSTGLTGVRAFGFFAERIRYVNEMAAGMGATFEVFQDEIADNAKEVFGLGKALGITGENMGAIARRTKAFGDTLTGTLADISKNVIGFSKRFGVSSKLIGRDVTEMIGDVRNFGNMAPSELAKVSVYSRKLGIEFKNLLGVVDQFDTFENAAVSAAKLSQAFGANVDAVRLMRTENPADRIEQLREAFFRAGKSADQFNRQELKLLSQTVGLSEETARTVFSMNNMGVSMQDLEKQGKITEKRQLTAAEATMKLTSTVERIIKPFKQFTSFVTALFDGFARGVGMTGIFRKMLISLRTALRSTYEVGMRLGEAFVEMFPGIKGLINEFTSFFAVGKKANKVLTPMQKLLNSVKAAISGLFGSLGKGSGGVVTAFDRLQKAFEEFFGSSNGEMIKKEFGKIMKGAGNLIAGLVKVFAKGVVSISKNITEFIKDPNMFSKPKKETIFSSFIAPIVEAIRESWPKVKAALKDMIVTAWEKSKEDIKKFLWKGLMWTFLAIFSAAFVKSIATSLGLFAANLILSLGKKLADPKLWARVGVGIKNAFRGMFRAVFSPKGLKFLKFAGIITAVLGVFTGISKGIDKFGQELTSKFGSLEGKIGASAAGILDAFTFGLLSEDFIKDFGGWVASLSFQFFGFLEDVFGKDSIGKIKSFLDDTIMFLKTMGDAALKLFKPSEWENLGKDLILGLKIGFEWGVEKIKEIPGKVLDTFKSIFQIKSPSQEMLSIGRNITKGLAMGIGEMPDAMAAASNKSLDYATRAFANRNFIDRISSSSPAAEAIKNMVEETNALSDALRSSGPLDVEARLEQLANGLGIDKKQLEIKNRDFKAVINLNVIMESDKLADAVIHTKRVLATGE